MQLAKPQSSRDTGQPAGVYLLQKWSTTWQTFIESIQEIDDKDRLTVVPMPGSSPKAKAIKLAKIMYTRAIPCHLIYAATVFYGEGTEHYRPSEKAHRSTSKSIGIPLSIHQLKRNQVGAF